MKKTGMILLAVIMAAFLARAQAADEKSAAKGGQSGDDLKKLDQHLADAFVKGDAEMIGHHLADDFILTDPVGGVWDKQKYLQAIKSKTLKIQSIKESDVKVQKYGNMAVVTGMSDIKGKARDHDISGQDRWTHVYINKDGRWQVVAEQITRVYSMKTPPK